jgi:hypothetical protein
MEPTPEALTEEARAVHRLLDEIGWSWGGVYKPFCSSRICAVVEPMIYELNRLDRRIIDATGISSASGTLTGWFPATKAITAELRRQLRLVQRIRVEAEALLREAKTKIPPLRWVRDVDEESAPSWYPQRR